ncbi:preprotein translocase subunit SecE [Fructilactobacillus sp. Tb1]|uniref:preprotein translocase subunit SecE n=1 Tax=Fructilactobacillus sp. Tb1 TaxID=3422304 RepID=UPI003D2B6534
MKRLWNFFKSVGTEMKLVVWPNAKQTRTDTLTVIGTTIFFTVFLGLIDWAVQTALIKL